MRSLFLSTSLFLSAQSAFAERGINIDVGGFMDATRDATLMVGNGFIAIVVIITAIGLMIPGFRETTKRALPWIVLGISLIVLVTKYWR